MMSSKSWSLVGVRAAITFVAFSFATPRAVASPVTSSSKKSLRAAIVLPWIVLPAKCRATLRFLQQKVAVGAIANAAHQSGFEIRVVDKRGRPRAGVQVGPPAVISGGRGPKNGTLTARVSLDAANARAKNGRIVTNASGIVRGTFTSGNRRETTVIGSRIHPGGGILKASIKQVWSELTHEQTFPEADNGNVDDATPTRVTNVLKFQNGSRKVGSRSVPVWVPIIGHHLSLEFDNIKGQKWNPKAGSDQDEDGKPDGVFEKFDFSDGDANKTGWQWIMSLMTISAMHDNGDGSYTGFYSIRRLPGLDGEDTILIDHVHYTVWDNDSYDLEGLL